MYPCVLLFCMRHNRKIPILVWICSDQSEIRPFQVFWPAKMVWFFLKNWFTEYILKLTVLLKSTWETEYNHEMDVLIPDVSRQALGLETNQSFMSSQTFMSANFVREPQISFKCDKYLYTGVYVGRPHYISPFKISYSPHDFSLFWAQLNLCFISDNYNGYPD